MGRLEFRVVGAKLAEQRVALSEMSADVERETRENLYLVRTDTTRIYKLRGGKALDPSDIAGTFERSGYIAVKTWKSRTRWKAGACLAQMTRVSLQGQPDVWTVAIEGSDTSELDRLEKTVCLRNSVNQSYPDWPAGMLFPQS